MNIAFYAPMKSPYHPRPSGDRRIAKLLIKALKASGYKVELMSELRAWEGAGDPDRQAEIRSQGQAIAQKLIRKLKARPLEKQPACWFSYHLFHKAPDWIGPKVAEAMDIPYLVAEASWAPKQVDGPWSQGLKQVSHALKQSTAVFCLNSRDLPALETIVESKTGLHSLPPFLDTSEIPPPDPSRRLRMSKAYDLKVELPWIVSVAMMRQDAKLDSYRLLAESLTKIKQPFQLLLIGDGKARSQVEKLFADKLASRTRFTGQLEHSDTLELMSVCDLFAWPAVNEAIGMALLEAQGCGLPVVAGASGAIPQIVRQGETGLLCTPGDTGELAAAIESLLARPERRNLISQASIEHVRRHHSLAVAANTLNRVISSLLD